MKLVAPGRFRREEVPCPRPGPGEVLIRITRAGICGSDLHVYRGQNPVIKPPVMMGHEATGVVEAAGEGVTSRRAGDRVVVIPYVACGECRYCRAGRANVCERLLTIGGMDHNGAFADFMVMPAEWTVQMPSDLDWNRAVLVEPVTVAVHAARRAGILADRQVAVIGGGTIGLLLCRVVKTYGAAQVLDCEPVPRKRALARKMGADRAVAPTELRQVRQRGQSGDGNAYDVVFDCVLETATVDTSLRLAKHAGTVVAVGIPPRPVNTGFIDVICHELTLIGTYLYLQADFEEALRLITEERVDVDSLITDEFGLEETGEAFRQIESSRGESVKTILRVSE
jgi:L-iditol 2-dehydrogenase